MAVSKIVGIASDHAGFPLKQFVLQYLEEKGIEYKDFSEHTVTSLAIIPTLLILLLRISSLVL